MTYHELLVIDDGMLRSMAMDPQYIRAFPCLQGHTAVLQSRPQKCPRCENAARTNSTRRWARQCIGHLDANSVRPLSSSLTRSVYGSVTATERAGSSS